MATAINTAALTGSSLDVKSIVNQLMQVERRPIEALQSRLDSSGVRITALGNLQSKFSALQDAVEFLQTPDNFKSFSTSSSNGGVLGAAAGSVPAKRPGAIWGKRRGEGFARGVQVAQIAADVGVAGAGAFQHTLDETGAPLCGAEHKRQEDVVHIEAPAFQLVAPSRIQGRAERILGGGRKVGADPAANHMMIDGQPGAGRAAQNGLADRLAVVEFLVSRCLEWKAGQLQRLDQQAVSRLQGQVVEMSSVGQAIPHLGLARRKHLGCAR
jgi:hypothetical protein